MALRRLANAPELPDEALMGWQLFNDLSADRSFGFGPGPIPTMTMHAWLDRHDAADAEQRYVALRVARALDNLWLEQQAKRLKDRVRNP